MRELGASLQPHLKGTETLQLVTWRAKRVRQNMPPGTQNRLLKLFFERENAWPGVFPLQVIIWYPWRRELAISGAHRSSLRTETVPNISPKPLIDS